MKSKSRFCVRSVDDLMALRTRRVIRVSLYVSVGEYSQWLCVLRRYPSIYSDRPDDDLQGKVR